MRRLALIAASLAVLAVASPVKVEAQPYVGEVISTGHDFCPLGWAPMNGQLLPISENENLFFLIGTTYGGDGEETFALPKAKPIVSATGKTLTQCISLFGVSPSQL
jgi:microcystin-dependent protein